MPDGVRAAMKKIMMSAGEMTPDDAERYLEQMDSTGRYQTETWS